MNKEPFLLAKFGEKEHLELIKEGHLYFNPIQKYRDDGTDWRGDKNEGTIPIDPCKISIKNSEGKDIFIDLGIPRPTKVSEFIQGDENTFIFCSAMITQNILILRDGHNKEYILNETFKKSIQNFGEYVLIFNPYEILGRLRTVRSKHKPEFAYRSGSIIYRDLQDFSERGDYSTAYNISNSVYDRYFVKDISYKNQNEWRLLIDGTCKYLEPNCGEGFSIFIGKLAWTYLFETSAFLNTFQYSVDN